MLFGEYLLNTRKKKNVSQEKLAKTIDIQAPVIEKYEYEELKSPIEIATKIAEVLGVSLHYLTGLSDLELK